MQQATKVMISHTAKKLPLKSKPPFFSGMLTKVSCEKEKWVSHFGTWVVDKIARSNQARQQLSSLPLSLLATFFKGVVNFLILYRLTTGYNVVDLLLSVAVTIFTACMSPVFYVIVQQKEEDILRFTNHVSDRIMSRGGIEYALQLRNRSILLISVVAIMFLLCFEVNSYYLIRCIMEYLLSFWIVDQVTQFRESLYTPIPVQYVEEFYQCEIPHQLTKYNYETIAIPRASSSKVQIVKPKRARVIPSQKITLVATNNRKQKKVAGSNVIIIDDWVRK